MRCVRPGRIFLLLLTAAVASLVVARAASAAVQIGVSSVTVAQPGDSGRVCVALSTGGQEVAGTENRLVWDGSCATLPPDRSSCYAAGSHGKQLSWDFPPNTDFTMKALVLSLSDVDPIDDGVLYCCDFQGEAEAGSCCNITVVAPGASDSSGNALQPVLGSSGSICTARSQGGGPIGGINPGQVLGGGNTGDAGAGQVAAPAGQGAGAPAAPAAPVSQVLQGGGVVAPTAVAEVDAPTVGATAAVAAPTAAVPGAAVAPATRAAAVTAAVAASPAAPATAAATAPAPADTPTAAVPTEAPTTAAPAATSTVPAPTATAKSGGWFGCHIGGGSAAPALALALLFAAGAWIRRRSHPSR